MKPTDPPEPSGYLSVHTEGLKDLTDRLGVMYERPVR